MTIEQLNQNIAQSNETSIDTAILHRIKQLRHKALDVQRQARSLLDRVNRSGFVLNDVLRFLQRLETYKIETVVVPEVTALQQAMAGFDAWYRRLAELLDADPKGDVQAELAAVVSRIDMLACNPNDATDIEPEPLPPLEKASATSDPLPEGESPAPVAVAERPLLKHMCFCRAPEEEGPKLQCIKCLGLYHGECLDIPLKSVKAFKVSFLT